MNSQLQSFARNTIKEGLKKCTEAQQTFFKRLYANGNLELPIEEVVDRMLDSELDWAMEQVQRTIEKNEKGDRDAKNS